MRVRVGAVLVLILMTNYSFATVTSCKSLFVKLTRPVLSLKKEKRYNDIRPFEKKYSKFEISLLKKAISILNNRTASLEQKQQSLIVLIHRQDPESFNEVYQNSKIIIEYMLNQNYLRDMNKFNPKDRLFSAFVKGTSFFAYKQFGTQIFGRKKSVSEQYERRFIDSRSDFRWFLYTEVTRRFATAINYANIIEFVLKDMENTQAKVPLSSEELQIRRGLLYDIVQSKKVNGLGLNIILNIVDTAYKIHDSKDLEAILEPLAGFSYIQGGHLKLELSEAQKEFFMRVLFRMINFSRNRNLSVEGLSYVEKIKKFAETLLQPETKDLKTELDNTLNDLTIIKSELLKQKPEAFVDTLVEVELNKDLLDLLLREYVKKNGKISNETYFLLNELDLKPNTIEYLEKNLASQDLFDL